jgi:putative ABC transport system ATP-binding protein
MKGTPMIRIENLKKVYAPAGAAETTALAGVDLEIPAGEFVSIMGPSGSGKSTLLNILGLLDPPSAGEYLFDGKPTSSLTERQRTDLRGRRMGFVFQSFNLVEELTVFENVELPLLYGRVPAAERRKRAEELLDRMGILPRRDHFPSQLSGGQQQRVAVCRAVAARPPLLLADEPTGNLDSAQGDEVMGLLKGLNEQGTTIVMVTHSLACAHQGHRILSLLDGKLAETPRAAQAV